MRTAEKSEPKRGSKKPRCDAVNGWPPANSARMFASNGGEKLGIWAGADSL